MKKHEGANCSVWWRLSVMQHYGSVKQEKCNRHSIQIHGYLILG